METNSDGGDYAFLGIRLIFNEKQEYSKCRKLN